MYEAWSSWATLVLEIQLFFLPFHVYEVCIVWAHVRACTQACVHTCKDQKRDGQCFPPSVPTLFLESASLDPEADCLAGLASQQAPGIFLPHPTPQF